MVVGDGVVEKDDAEKQVGDLVSRIPKEHLKALFYLYAGKPDSRIKVFTDPVALAPSDIIELNSSITRKLNGHSIHAQVTSVTVGYNGADIQEFGSWAEFLSHSWQEPNCVEEVVVKWDFMLTVQQYEAPQRHTLLVRISSDMKPGKFFQLLASGNADEFEKLDVMTAPAFCRVDFINAQISKELINEVSDWYAGRARPLLIPSFYYWFKKQRNRIAMVIHYSFPMMLTFVWLGLYFWSFSGEGGSSLILHSFAWLFGGIFLLQPFGKIGHSIASKTFAQLGEIAGNRVVFSFTSGDRRRNSEIMQRNQRQGRRFLVGTGWALFMNVVAGVIASYLYTNS